jgi:ParB family transcriptional regulator, chromosome partitioning protein
MALKISASNLMPGLIEDLDIYRIKQPSRFVRHSNNIEGLAESLRKSGLLQPIIVRSRLHENNQEITFEIVAGIRRYLACKLLGWKKITCHIVEVDDREAFEISLVENVQRHTLSPIEEAQAFKKYVRDYGWGGVLELSTRIGKSPSYITKRIKLLDLPEDVLEAITNSSMSISTAEELLAVNDPCEQSELSALISKRHLSLRKVREIVKDSVDQNGDKPQDKKDDIFQSPICSVDYLTDVERAFDKSIIAIKIAMNRLATIIEECDDDISITREMLMYHRSVLHEQIDLLIKEKKKVRKRYVR